MLLTNAKMVFIAILMVGFTSYNFGAEYDQSSPRGSTTPFHKLENEPSPLIRSSNKEHSPTKKDSPKKFTASDSHTIEMERTLSRAQAREQEDQQVALLVEDANKPETLTKEDFEKIATLIKAAESDQFEDEAPVRWARIGRYIPKKFGTAMLVATVVLGTLAAIDNVGEYWEIWSPDLIPDWLSVTDSISALGCGTAAAITVCLHKGKTMMRQTYSQRDQLLAKLKGMIRTSVAQRV